MAVIFFVLAICSFSSADQDLHERVVYGEDNRLDLYQVTDPALLALADSTVGLINLDRLEEQPDSWKIAIRPYAEKHNLCTSEKFYDQLTAPSCTGFLVAPDKVATAGHCVENFEKCTERKYVFGYSMAMDGANPTEIPKSEVYSCAKVISSGYQNGVDYALVELDRPVTNHLPLKLNLTGQIADGTPLFVMGHPAGLPLKLVAGAYVRSSDDAYFVSNLDTYGGNSGSPVFNAETYEVEGILVRGELDYVQNPQTPTCNISNVCANEGCRGETSTKVSALKPFLN